MRQLPKRPKLPVATIHKLLQETVKIKASINPKETAEIIYTNARQSVWFIPVIHNLNKITGHGSRCIYCSGSEASNVEHFKPKADFPLFAMSWENYLWICSICNQAKSNQFPFIEGGRHTLINPIEENVWDYFYIDSYGNLTPLWDTNIDDFNYRGKETARIIDLDRQALQESRRSKMDDLKSKVKDTIKLIKNKSLSNISVKRRLSKWRKQPFQPDVADYFLNGPGRSESPFKQLFDLLI